MLIEVLFNAISFPERDLRDTNVVIIDVLRTSTTIITALQNGAKSIVPTATLGDAGRIAMNLDAKVFLLGGEKSGVKIDGYHLSMSPLEYDTEIVEKRTIIMHTTQTTATILESKTAHNTFIGGFINARSLTNRLLEDKKDVLMVCIGDPKHHVSIADTLCAGYLVDLIKAKKRKYTLGDGAIISHVFYQKEKNQFVETVSQSTAALKLIDLGYEADIMACLHLNTHELLPVFNPNTLSISAQ